MSGPTPRQAETEEEEAEGEDAGESLVALASDAGSIERLASLGDADKLLELAKAFRSGTGGVARDFERCFQCYRAAAELGSAEARFSVALFHLTGGVVAQDLKLGATELRSAADLGSTPAKVYLANLYELGIHYKVDREKADVWYRNAARAAGIKADAETAEYARALAELGSARHAVAIANDPATSDADKTFLLKKARAFGYQLKIRGEAEPASATPASIGALRIAPEAQSAETSEIALPKVETSSAARASTRPAAAPQDQAKPARASTPAPEPKAKQSSTPPKSKLGKPSTKPSAFALRAGMSAFAYAVLFVALGWGAGYLLTQGAMVLASQNVVPVVVDHVALIMPACVALLSIVSAFLVYRFGAVLRAVGFSLLVGVGGYAAWHVPQGVFLPWIEVQTAVFASAAFLASLLVLGLLGGSKLGRKKLPPKMSIGTDFSDV